MHNNNLNFTDLYYTNYRKSRIINVGSKHDSLLTNLFGLVAATIVHELGGPHRQQQHGDHARLGELREMKKEKLGNKKHT
jgi:hypothetical protein